jgi:hypothetical protein
MINFHKNEFFCFGDVRDVNLYVKLFGCGLSYFLISYLGILIHYWGLTLAE